MSDLKDRTTNRPLSGDRGVVTVTLSLKLATETDS